MNNPGNSKNFFSMSEDQFKRMMAVSMAIVTVLAAIVAYLQSDASALDDQANRDSKRYSLEAFGSLVSGDARSNFDDNVVYQNVYELGLLAQSAENRGDEAAAERYHTMMSEASALSPLMAPPYYDLQGEAEPDVARYEAESYLVENFALQEQFAAASVVKDAWDYKSNTYIIHLTLLAVALFLFGLSVTISNGATRWIFAIGGFAVTAFAILWAAVLWARPVFDLRQQGTAIADYAAGAGLAYQGRHEEAVAAFDKALQSYPAYANALADRASAYLSLEDYESAADDYESARAAGDRRAYVAGDLAWTYYMLGDFPKAVEMNQIALAASPDELWIRFDLGLSLLASGQPDAAQAEYARGMEQAAKQVAEANAANAAPPSDLWWSLQDAAGSLEDLLAVLDGEGDAPPTESLSDPEALRPAAEALIAQLKSLAVSLEYKGAPPSAPLAAQIGELAFATSIYDDQHNFVDYSEPAQEFPYETNEIGVLFDFSGMQDGQEVIFKLYVDGEEDPSWRLIYPWAEGASGSSEILLSYAYSDTYVFAAGEYQVELYVDGQLAQSGEFVIAAP